MDNICVSYIFVGEAHELSEYRVSHNSYLIRVAKKIKYCVILSIFLGIHIRLLWYIRIVSSGISTCVNFVKGHIVTNTNLFAVYLVCVRCPGCSMDNQILVVNIISFRLSIFKNVVTLFNCGQCCDEYLYPSITVSKFINVWNICFYSLMNRCGHYCYCLQLTNSVFVCD